MPNARGRRHQAGGPLASMLLAVAAAPAPAQDALPTAEEMTVLAAAAEAAPLFAENTPLAVTLRTRIQWLRDERPDEEEADGTLTYVDATGTPVTVDVEVRTRGNFRRDRRNCNFPPLRLDLPRTRVGGTVFEGQNRLKLVTPCHDGRDDYQRYVLLEYLAYRTLQLVTPASYRVRLLEITYEDVDGEYDTRTKLGFVIEDVEAMAHRNRATPLDLPQIHPARVEGARDWTVALFQYMIGNADWSGPMFHNMDLIRAEDGRYLYVPYDFDFSGLVDARYANPPTELGIRSVRDRVFRGFCRDNVERAAVVARFLELRPDVEALYRSMALLEEDRREDAVDYLEDFWDTLESPSLYDRRIQGACRAMPGA